MTGAEEGMSGQKEKEIVMRLSHMRTEVWIWIWYIITEMTRPTLSDPKRVLLEPALLEQEEERWIAGLRSQKDISVPEYIGRCGCQNRRRKEGGHGLVAGSGTRERVTRRKWNESYHSHAQLSTLIWTSRTRPAREKFAEAKLFGSLASARNVILEFNM